MNGHSKFFTGAKIVTGAIVSLAAIIGVVYGFNAFLDIKINNKMNDPVLLQQIATHVRPSLIFDAKGVILVDMGAMQYIDNLSVQTSGRQPFADRVVVQPKHYLAHAPLITAIDPVTVFVHDNRGPGITWEYALSYGMTFIDEKVQTVRYRLEVIP